MSTTFERDGIRFTYPENWVLTQEENENGWTASLQSPATAFFLVTYDGDMPESELMAETALDAMKAEYDSLESEPVTESIADQPAVGHDMRFFSFDLTNTCWTRCFYTPTGTVLFFAQTNDLELEYVEPLFRAVCKSIQIEQE